MSKRRRLTKEECIILGLDYTGKDIDGRHKRRTLTKEQIQQIDYLRSLPNKRKFVNTQNKLDKDGNIVSSVEKLQSKGIDIPENFEVIKISNSETTGQQWVQYAPKQKDKKELEQFKEQFLKDLSNYSPAYPKIEREPTKEGHLLVIDIADLHINKYACNELTGAKYNSNLAVKRAIKGTKGILSKSRGYDIDKILFVIGNDVLNTDTITKTTTKGTLQDTDNNWFDAYKIAYDCYVECLELCLSVANVDVIHCPSNHDYMSGCFLAETLKAHFNQCLNINFDTSPAYRKYYQYYNNLIELEHGDKGKQSELPLIIAQSQPKLWANTKFRYAYLHHIHHSDKRQFQSSKDYVGLNVTYLRSPSSADLWHYESGYINLVAVEGFIHSKDNGRVAHLTHYF